MVATKQLSRQAFSSYWEDYGVFRWRQVRWYVGYLGGLALYAFIIRTIDADGRLWLASLLLAVAYLVLVPYLTIRRLHTRFASFIRCPHCGDWFGQDASGSYFGPNPKFRAIIETGRCSKCGEKILSDYEDAA
jgi:hypothetical protein